jgi:hypothetical protein
VIKRAAEERLPQELATLWQGGVRRHLQRHPLRAEEKQALLATEGEHAQMAIEHNPLLIYGATILVVVATKDFLLYIQLGDGDILVVSDEGRVQRPLARDERLFANETTSLSAPRCWEDCNVAFQAAAAGFPSLIVASTDGYSNSFKSEEQFLRVGTDLLEALRNEGAEEVEKSLCGWLKESAEKSGDDVTVGILVPRQVIQKSHKSEASSIASVEAILNPGEGGNVPLTLGEPRARENPGGE